MVSWDVWASGKDGRRRFALEREFHQIEWDPSLRDEAIALVNSLDSTQKLQMRDPAWTPDGRRIAFIAASPVNSRGGRIWTVDVNGGRDIRVCAGSDGQQDGRGDNWGSWLPECTNSNDPWCDAGNIAMEGGMDWDDISQNYEGHASSWTTGVKVHDVIDSQAECGSALAFFSSAGTIQNVTNSLFGLTIQCAKCHDPKAPPGTKPLFATCGACGSSRMSGGRPWSTGSSCTSIRPSP